MGAILTFEEALAKMQRYCSYQERCHNEVRTKLISIKVYGDTLEEVISVLIQEDFLNEQRFAETFTSGKYRLKAWGRNKIKMALKAKYISDYCIKKALASIDELDYLRALEISLRKYHNRYKTLNPFQLRGKMFQYALRKGYLHTEINKVIDEILLTEKAIYSIE